MTYRTPCSDIAHQVLSTLPIPNKLDDFPWAGKYFEHVPLLTNLIYFPPKGITW